MAEEVREKKGGTKELSELLGVTIRAVRQSIESGRITAVEKDPYGKYLINLPIACHEWFLKKDHSKDTSHPRNDKLPVHPDFPIREQSLQIESFYKAIEKQVGIEEKLGTLISIDKIKREVFLCTRTARDKFLALPELAQRECTKLGIKDRVSLKLVNKLRKESNRLLDELSETLEHHAQKND